VDFDVVAARKVRLSDVVTAQMMDWLSGGLQVGAVLPSESELARRFSVSKPVIREALGRLAAIGALDIRQGRPAVVSELNSGPLREFFALAAQMKPEGLREAVELRRVIETPVAALAAERATDADIEELRALLDDMTRQTDIEGWIEADIRFHLGIARVARNGLISFLMDALQETMRFTTRSLQKERGPRDPSQRMKNHIAVFEAIERRDPAAAAAAMTLHFAASKEIIAKILADRALKAARPKKRAGKTA
jgi:GntR family transcriptional repressor for pyruvate dehydrogenase complex